MSPDYNVTPFKSSEQGPKGEYNLPPARFEDNGAAFRGPAAAIASGRRRRVSVGTNDARHPGRGRRPIPMARTLR
jgi:hypothetical protein